MKENKKIILKVGLASILIGLFGIIIVLAIQPQGTIKYSGNTFSISENDNLNVGGSLTVGKGLTVSSNGLNVTGGLTVATGNITLSADNALVDGINLDNAVTTLSNGTGIAAFTNIGNSRTISITGSVPTSCSAGTGISCSISNNTLSVSVDDTRYLKPGGGTMTDDLVISGNLTIEGDLDVVGLIGKGSIPICKRYLIGTACPANYFTAIITESNGEVRNPQDSTAIDDYRFCCWAEQ